MGVHRDTESETSSEGFAERWSRLKQANEGKAETASDTSELPHTASDTQPALTDDDMPPVETLDEKSDFAAFLSPGVSEHLRAQALRKLFQLPGLSIPDGLDDYDDDFTQFTELGNAITHEMRRMLERQSADREAPADAQSEDAVVAEADTVERLQEAHEEEQQLAAAPSAPPAGDDNDNPQGRAE